MVLLIQEFYYITKGAYRHKKTVRYCYAVQADGTYRIIQVLHEGQQPKQSGYITELPSVEVTPREFKRLVQRKAV